MQQIIKIQSIFSSPSFVLLIIDHYWKCDSIGQPVGRSVDRLFHGAHCTGISHPINRFLEREMCLPIDACVMKCTRNSIQSSILVSDNSVWILFINYELDRTLIHEGKTELSVVCFCCSSSSYRCHHRRRYQFETEREASIIQFQFWTTKEKSSKIANRKRSGGSDGGSNGNSRVTRASSIQQQQQQQKTQQNKTKPETNARIQRKWRRSSTNEVARSYRATDRNCATSPTFLRGVPLQNLKHQFALHYIFSTARSCVHLSLSLSLSLSLLHTHIRKSASRRLPSFLLASRPVADYFFPLFFFLSFRFLLLFARFFAAGLWSLHN